METPRRALRNVHLNNVQQISTPLKIPASPFLKTLGYGTGVNVYRLDRSPKWGQVRSPWAVKRVTQRTRATGRSELFTARIQEEANILRKLKHPNIVGFRAVVKSNDGVDNLALECCNDSLGSILEEIHDNNGGPLPSNKSFRMIKDVASALDYLHTEAKLLHGDLKSFNVLVKGDFVICKLCDFGVSLPLDENGEIDMKKNRYVGTDLWSAPEVIDEADVIDSKADIFSFGLIIYETIALVPPHTLEVAVLTESKSLINENAAECANESNDLFETEDSFIENVETAYGTRPPLPQAFNFTEDYNSILELFYCCTNELPEDRPSASTILKLSLRKKDS